MFHKTQTSCKTWEFIKQNQLVLNKDPNRNSRLHQNQVMWKFASLMHFCSWLSEAISHLAEIPAQSPPAQCSIWTPSSLHHAMLTGQQLLIFSILQVESAGKGRVWYTRAACRDNAGPFNSHPPGTGHPAQHQHWWDTGERSQAWVPKWLIQSTDSYLLTTC